MRIFDSGGSEISAQGNTDSQGLYTVDVPAASYTVCFYDTSMTYANECHNNVAWDASGWPVTLPAGTTPVPVTSYTTAVTVNASLALLP